MSHDPYIKGPNLIPIKLSWPLAGGWYARKMNYIMTCPKSQVCWSRKIYAGSSLSQRALSATIAWTQDLLILSQVVSHWVIPLSNYDIWNTWALRRVNFCGIFSSWPGMMFQFITGLSPNYKESYVSKTRLKNDAIKQQINKTMMLLKQKEELGDTLTEIDFQVC